MRQRGKQEFLLLRRRRHSVDMRGDRVRHFVEAHGKCGDFVRSVHADPLVVYAARHVRRAPLQRFERVQRAERAEHDDSRAEQKRGTADQNKAPGQRRNRFVYA
ncbi:hypothetical protein SDC9_66280 [bioreactor metagenome]|uniref:Uncharacterized protein n=1 Tax=bioreactor metagenome TaxID=1076179 RepID=A0A644Y010_9ZZZZ